jgi:DNA-directed RNA polymerase subunit omega
MNSELLKQASVKVLDPHVLVNLISRRVRQLNGDAGARSSRSLVANPDNLGVADIALLEIVEGKMGFEMAKIIQLTRPTGKNGRRPQGWKAMQ